MRFLTLYVNVTKCLRDRKCKQNPNQTLRNKVCSLKGTPPFEKISWSDYRIPRHLLTYCLLPSRGEVWKTIDNMIISGIVSLNNIHHRRLIVPKINRTSKTGDGTTWKSSATIEATAISTLRRQLHDWLNEQK